ncbi:uncharacterized protein LOC135468235 isoform X2 [Liolophura sinensis]|uniref:uncharacterized protein LOC135468235 isoform X2 n=1 Tax=Liolophura sinensis TaxID=3198878 RepID=UPI00315846A6
MAAPPRPPRLKPDDKRGPKPGTNVALNAHKLPVNRSETAEKHEQVKTDEDYIYSEAIAQRSAPEQYASPLTATVDAEKQEQVKTDEDYMYAEAIARRRAPEQYASPLTATVDDYDDGDGFIYDDPKTLSSSSGGPHKSSPLQRPRERQIKVKTDDDYIYDVPTNRRSVPERKASSRTTADCDDGDGFIYDEPKTLSSSSGGPHKSSPSQHPRAEKHEQVKTDEDYMYAEAIARRRAPEQYASPLTTTVDDYDDGDGFIYDDPKTLSSSSGGPHKSSPLQRPRGAEDYYGLMYDIAKPSGNFPAHQTKTSATQSGPGLRVTTTENVKMGAGQKAVEMKPPKPLTMAHSLKVEGDQIKIVLQLRSPETEAGHFRRVPMRVVCLFDISGSMGQQFGSKARRRETKIVKMRNIAKLITNTLDDMDYLGVIAFGNDTEVLSPMTKNEPSAKKEVLSKVRELGRNGLSLTTNLSRAMFAAINMFRQDSKERGWKCSNRESRDMIMVLTDGDINDGVTDGQELVRQVRQAIRELEMEGNHFKKDPSLTISTVVTGNNVSDAVYMLSKTCGNDAFFYIEKDSDILEIGALMPVLLRMNSVANSISVQAEALDPAELLPKLCGHEYMAHRPHERDDEICYFLHDLGLGMSKHLLIVLDKESVMCETDMNAAVLRVKVEYLDAVMEKHTFTHEVMRSEFEDPQTQQSLAVSIQDIRRISQLALRQVAEDVREEKGSRAVAHLLQSIEEVETHVENHCQELRVASEKQQLTNLAQSVTANLANLMRVIEDSQKTTGNKWAAVKSVSSAIVREAPSATRLLGQQNEQTGNTVMSREVSEMRRMIRDQYAKNGVKSAIFYDFDVTMMEFTNSLQRGVRLPRYPEVNPSITSAEGMTDQTHSEPASDDLYVYSSQMTNS